MTQVLNDISPPATIAPLRAALTEATRRCGFSPEALEALERTIDDVYRELVDDGVAGGRALRNRLAQKLIAFACKAVPTSRRRSCCSGRSATKPWPLSMPDMSPESRGLRLRALQNHQ